MKILIFIGLMLLGVLAYYVFKSSKYIISGRFYFKKWYAENFAFYIWGCAVAVVLGVIYGVAPDSVGAVLTYFGTEATNINAKPAPVVMVGIFIAGSSRRIIKPAKPSTPTPAGNEN